jgi:TM2 domain-containing membrane protein YozV
MKGKSLQTLGFLLLFIFALSSLSPGKTLVLKNEETLSLEDQLAQNDLEHYQKFSRLTNSYFAYESDSMEEKKTTDVYGFKGKSVKKAFLYSLIIPGTGEFYAGSKIKAVLFFGLDVTFWALYFNYHGKGKDEEDKYKAFADEYWSKGEYEDWLYDSVYHTTQPNPKRKPISIMRWSGNMSNLGLAGMIFQRRVWTKFTAMHI